MKTPIDIIIKAKKEMNQNDFSDWLEETLPIFKDLEKSHITKAHLSGGLNRIMGQPPMTSEEYFNKNYND